MAGHLPQDARVGPAGVCFWSYRDSRALAIRCGKIRPKQSQYSAKPGRTGARAPSGLVRAGRGWP